MEPKTRAKLKALASKERTALQIGKGGLEPAVFEAIENCLAARELIKIGVLGSCTDEILSLAETICQPLKAEVVTVIGSKIILYRKSSRAGIRHLLETDKGPEDPHKKPNESKKTNFKGEHYASAVRFFDKKSDSSKKTVTKKTNGAITRKVKGGSDGKKGTRA